MREIFELYEIFYMKQIIIRQYFMSGNEYSDKYYTQENIILATTVKDILNNTVYSTIQT